MNVTFVRRKGRKGGSSGDVVLALEDTRQRPCVRARFLRASSAFRCWDAARQRVCGASLAQ